MRGARADFVAALGRRLAEVGATLDRALADARAPRHRDELKRRVHALGAGARLLRFGALASELARIEEQLASLGPQEPLPAEELRAMLEALPALAWTEPSQLEASPLPPQGIVFSPSPAAPEVESLPVGEAQAEEAAAPAPVRSPATAPRTPVTVLLVGSSALANALADEDASQQGTLFEVEHTADLATAKDFARALAPDVLILDADRKASKELAEALAKDPLTEAIPVVVLGQFAHADASEAFVSRGAAVVLTKPVTPAQLREACLGLIQSAPPASPGEPLGKLSLEALGLRLAEEVRRGLAQGLSPTARAEQLDMGEGTEVLAAVWGAVSRVRDLIEARSEGSVRFQPSGPEGAIAMSSLTGPLKQPRRAAPGETKRRQGAATLSNLRIVVADDDSAVTWFLAGVLREAGATVYEAHDGEKALELCFALSPDLVISDVLMPKLDGFALCRALKRDIVLRHTPVILLSWKEDLLQRVRELGVGADGYLRKEVSAETVVQQVLELMQSRQRIAERLATGGEVRGRLEGMTPRALLELCCRVRPDSSLDLRDASALYELDLRGGRPVRATRTASDGSQLRGPRALGALLAVGSGRFLLAPTETDAPIPTDLQGSLEEQLLPLLAKARAAQRLVLGSSLVQVERIRFAPEVLLTFADATPGSARALLDALAGGASPRELLTTGKAPARLLEDVLCDAAAHGAIVGVHAKEGGDLLPAAIEHEARLLRTAVPSLPLEPTPLGGLEAREEAGAWTPSSVSASIASGVPSSTFTASSILGSVVTAPPRASTPRASEGSGPSDVAFAAPTSATTSVASREVGAVEVEPSSPRPASPAEAAVEGEEVHEVLPLPATSAKGSKRRGASPATWALLAGAAAAFAVALRWGAPSGSSAEVPAAALPLPAAPKAVAAPVEAKSLPAAPKPPEVPALVEAAEITTDLPLNPEDRLPRGQGFLEVVAGASEAVYVDRRRVGEGPNLRISLAERPEPYEVQVRTQGEDRVRFVAVKAGRIARLRVGTP